MPQTSAEATSRAGLAPAPVAVLLPPTTSEPARPSSGLSAHTACQLIAAYTRSSDVVLDLDGVATVAAAARWLNRRALPSAHRERRPEGEPAQLVIARLPRPAGATIAGIGEWIRQCRQRTLPGGFLVVTLPADREPDEFAGDISTIIAAGRAAGLRYQQHLIDVRTPLPEHEPYAPNPALAGGRRHRRVHADLIVLARPIGSRDA